ncbi:MAG: alpha/beta hydrolase [Actinomycetia bacterium]|nr:alpha/beta hydrolase [Actinomycetes bacterium]
MAPPVLLLHGFATSTERTWREPGWFDLLGDARREVIGIDLLGHGEADKPHDPEAYAEMANLVAAQLPDEPVDVIGYSMGAGITLELALEDPSRFNRIVLAGVGENLLRPSTSAEILDAIEGRGNPDDMVNMHFKELAETAGNDPLALAACMKRERQPLTVEQLATVNVPILIVIGDKDFAGPPEPLAEALPDARVVTLRGVDHFGLPKQFGFIDAALEFLEAIPS